MRIKHKLRTGLLMSFLSLGCLWGCAHASPTAPHTIAEITAVSISCGQMDQRQSYSFWLHYGEDVWLFDASCFTNQKEIETQLTDCSITEEEKNAVFALLEQNDSIAFLEKENGNANKRKGSVDGESYGFALTFSDGMQYSSAQRQDALETFFYDLAEKYSNTTWDEP